MVAHLAASAQQRLPQQAVKRSCDRHRTPTEQRVALIASGFSETAADMRLGLEKLFNESVLAETTDTVELLTKQKPRSLSDWLASNLSLFRD